MNATVLAMVEPFLAFICSMHINSTPISHSTIPSPSLYPEGPKISPLLVHQIHGVRVEGGHNVLIKTKSSHKLILLLDVAATLAFLTNSGVTQTSSNSATQILVDLDIPQIAEFRTSYKWEAPSLQQYAPQVLQLSPIQGVGQIYTLDKIIELPATSFQGGATGTKWYYKACRN
ncbi:hypothetical protein PVAP13_9NG307992 [Panicum virgatum]|uniref:Uncharacterized protein n=1 Tax=Panicum virgatum TaxID=38727 RepID=A0A8T0MDU2_PANVG|nr:hypothetical protein PVAP13_9NG307992 [Panicum virgatum]